MCVWIISIHIYPVDEEVKIDNDFRRSAIVMTMLSYGV